MKPVIRLSLIFLPAVLPSVAAGAGQYNWFNDPPSIADASTARPTAFGMDIYRSTPDAGMPGADSGAMPEHKVSLYGDYSARAVRMAVDDGSRRFGNFGVLWQHRVSSSDRLSLSAEQGEGQFARSSATYSDTLTTTTRASLAWTRELSWSWKPSITGGVFLGDASARDDSIRAPARRYFGFAVGGEVRLLQSHTPYVSLRVERSLYDSPTGDDSMGSAPVRTSEDSSRLAAGWRWQASRALSLQAEASYGFSLGNSAVDPFSPERERSRLFFGTRFDFR